MSAELKAIHIYDMHMHRLFPEDIRYFGGILEASIGPGNTEGSDRFSALVCTPSWFEGNVLIHKPQDPTHETFYEAAFGTHHLFVLEFDETVIREAVKRLVQIHGRGEWSKAAVRLSRHLTWEYDDYDPSGDS